MISINRVYKTVLMLANSDVRGNIKPQDVRDAINDVVNEIYEDYFYEVNRMSNRGNRGLTGVGLENVTDRIREKLQHFLVDDVALVFSTPYFLLPADLRYIDTVRYNQTTRVDFCKSRREFDLTVNYPDTAPTVLKPIAIKSTDTSVNPSRQVIRIAPADIVGNVRISYLRNNVMANWTYNVVGGSEIFNPSSPDFSDIDLHPSEEHNVIIKTLNRFGINLKEQDLTAITTNEENQEFNQNNAT